MKLLIVDVETTGTDPSRDQVVELGACLYDTRRGIVWVRSELYACTENAAQHVNGIDPRMTEGARAWPGTGTPLPSWATSCKPDAVVSHGMFDSLWFSDEHRPWVDTLDGFTWLRHSTSKSLGAVALAHGVGMVRAHRAFDDVITLATCFERICGVVSGSSDLEERIVDASKPRTYVRAMVSTQRSHVAKAAGFRWDPERERWCRWAFTDESFDFDTMPVKP